MTNTTVLDLDRQRAEFEAWCERENTEAVYPPEHVQYATAAVKLAWKAWQAALARRSQPVEAGAPAAGGLPAMPGCLASRLYEAISIARGRAQHAGSTPRMKKWDATAADLAAALAAPVAQQSEAGSIDTEHFGKLLADYVRANAVKYNDFNAVHLREKLVSYIDGVKLAPQPTEAGAPTASASDMRLVPAQPTREMLIAMGKAVWVRHPADQQMHHVYAAMLAAAPTSGRESAAPAAPVREGVGEQDAKDGGQDHG